MQFVWRFMVSVTASNSPRLCLNQPLLSVLWQQHVTQLLHQTLAVWQVNCRQMRHPQEYMSAVRFSPSYTASVGWLFFTVPFSEVCFTSEILWSLKWKSVMDFIFTQASLKKKKKRIKISIFMVTPDLFLCWHGEFVAGDEAAHLLQRKAQKLLALHHISKMLLWETQTSTAHIKHCPSKRSLNENMFVVFAVQDT